MAQIDYPVGRREQERRLRQERARRTRRKLWMAAGTVALLMLAVIVGSVRGGGEKSGGISGVFTRSVKNNYTTVDEDWVTVDLLDVNPYSRPGTALPTVNAIVVHYVGNPSTTAKQNRDYFAGLAESGETSASSHFVVGLDGEVIQCVPLNEVSYCSNDRNGDTIAIECCHPGEDGAFNDATYQSLVKLVRYLCQLYRLDEDGVIRHYDVTGKLCPLYYAEHPDAWEQLKEEVFGSN